MSLPSPTRLRAATATGVPTLSVIDFSLGGLLVQATEPFRVGSVVHLQLSTEGGPCGTFALRCLHAHRTLGPDQTPAHISALVFVHPLDDRTVGLVAGLERTVHHRHQQQPRNGRRVLRFTSGPTD
ncbi:MAG: hypothetical protein IT183_07550 [Acidobacteria bacterium]|nr:hypothetical protein [Acidobacteriota bacterium]